MPSVEPDKRRAQRLELALPVRFFMSLDGSLAPRDGLTHNVSSSGVYFEAPVGQVTPDDPLLLRIAVPAREGEEQPNLTLVGSGAVQRAEKLEPSQVLGDWSEDLLQQGMWGLALQFQQRPTVELQSLVHLLWEDRQE